MGIDILHDRDEAKASFSCNTTGTAFGPVVHATAEHDADVVALALEYWVHTVTSTDPRRVKYHQWESLLSEFLRKEFPHGTLQSRSDEIIEQFEKCGLLDWLYAHKYCSDE